MLPVTHFFVESVEPLSPKVSPLPALLGQLLLCLTAGPASPRVTPGQEQGGDKFCPVGERHPHFPPCQGQAAAGKALPETGNPKCQGGCG